MKHRRGVELGRPSRDAITYIGPLSDPVGTAIDDVQEFMALGAMCRACEREGWVDLHAPRRKWGNAMLNSLQPRLRCLGCGNKAGNRWIVGQLPRKLAEWLQTTVHELLWFLLRTMLFPYKRLI